LLPTSYHFGLVLLKFLVSGGGAIAAAYLSRRYFEERFLRLKNRIVWRDSQTKAVASAQGVPGLPGCIPKTYAVWASHPDRIC
jgi:peptidoglycan/LPS O-acetylase OafA/YrhL